MAGQWLAPRVVGSVIIVLKAEICKSESVLVGSSLCLTLVFRQYEHQEAEIARILILIQYLAGRRERGW